MQDILIVYDSISPINFPPLPHCLPIVMIRLFVIPHSPFCTLCHVMNESYFIY